LEINWVFSKRTIITVKRQLLARLMASATP